LSENATRFLPARPETTPPVDEDEFRSAFNFAMLALTRKIPTPNPADRTITFEEEDGSLATYRFTDRPWARALMALADRYRGTREKYFAVCNRINAFLDLLDTGALDEWTRKAEGGRNVHDAVLDAAATTGLTQEGEFTAESFIKEVERIVAEKYGGEWVG
jgi:hypothetical protein